MGFLERLRGRLQKGAPAIAGSRLHRRWVHRVCYEVRRGLGRRLFFVVLAVLLISLLVCAPVFILSYALPTNPSAPFVESIGRTLSATSPNWLTGLFKPKPVEYTADEAAELRRKFRLRPTRQSSRYGVGWQGKASLSRQASDELKWDFALSEKLVPFVGHSEHMASFIKDSRPYINSLAVLAGYDSAERMHGNLTAAVEQNGGWQPTKERPPPVKDFPGGEREALRDGGFYLALSNALSLDRIALDSRDGVCKHETYDLSALPDASVIITFFNEPLSTLLRTVHSVLNLTPPPLLREIILVDDHSNREENLAGSLLDTHIALLPKVKLIRMHQRQGIVHARIVGAKAAIGKTLVVLDSHVELNPGWLEPQLAAVRNNPEAVVFPQILGVDAETFDYKANFGIGCRLSFRWMVVEQASLTGKVTSTAPIPSPSMAGGLLAVDRNYFWEIGGYDEDFTAWGAENVEMPLRVWSCGGQVLCAPCARTYHIYRKSGSGYSNPTGALWRNRQRTARLWMDDHFQLARRLIDLSASKPLKYDSNRAMELVPISTINDNSPVAVMPQSKTVIATADSHASSSRKQLYVDSFLGSFDRMLDLKEKLQCKSFQWFLQNVEPQHDAQVIDDVIALGRIRAAVATNTTNLPNIKQSQIEWCLDNLGNRSPGSEVGIYQCQSLKHMNGNQGFLIIKNDGRIRFGANDKRCLGFQSGKFSVVNCGHKDSEVWTVQPFDSDKETKPDASLDSTNNSIDSTQGHVSSASAQIPSASVVRVRLVHRHTHCLTAMQVRPESLEAKPKAADGTKVEPLTRAELAPKLLADLCSGLDSQVWLLDKFEVEPELLPPQFSAQRQRRSQRLQLPVQMAAADSRGIPANAAQDKAGSQVTFVEGSGGRRKGWAGLRGLPGR